MRERLQRILLLTLAVLAAQTVLSAPEDRFKGGINDGYDKNSALDAPVPVSGPRIKINGVPHEQVKSINGAGLHSIINGIRY